MAWIDKVNNVLHDVGELADDGINRVKNGVTAKQEQTKIDALYRRAGQLLFDEYEKTGHCDERLRSIFIDIQRHQEILAGLNPQQNTTAQDVHCTRVYGQSDPAQGVGRTRPCPVCGTLCIDSAAYCTQCGNSLQ